MFNFMHESHKKNLAARLGLDLIVELTMHPNSLTGFRGKEPQGCQKKEEEGRSIGKQGMNVEMGQGEANMGRGKRRREEREECGERRQ